MNNVSLVQIIYDAEELEEDTKHEVLHIFDWCLLLLSIDVIDRDLPVVNSSFLDLFDRIGLIFALLSPPLTFMNSLAQSALFLIETKLYFLPLLIILFSGSVGLECENFFIMLPVWCD